MHTTIQDLQLSDIHSSFFFMYMPHVHHTVNFELLQEFYAIF